MTSHWPVLGAVVLMLMTSAMAAPNADSKGVVLKIGDRHVHLNGRCIRYFKVLN